MSVSISDMLRLAEAARGPAQSAATSAGIAASAAAPPMSFDAADMMKLAEAAAQPAVAVPKPPSEIWAPAVDPAMIFRRDKDGHGSTVKDVLEF